jgi:hypothetical protein
MNTADPARLQMCVVKQVLVRWDGERPEDADRYADKSRHPKCLEIVEIDAAGRRTIYQRDKQIWL